ncbi:MAG: 50S ribosomal protein L30e [archaeon]
MIDLNRQVKILMRTGKFSFGANEALEAAKSGRAKIIILTSNCPEPDRSDIMRYAGMSGVPTYASDVTSSDLGIICEKPYVVSALSVSEAGDSEILKLVVS